MKKEIKGGFRKISKLEQLKGCKHPEHNPPGMICLEPGLYEYECPGCGSVKRIRVPTKPFLAVANGGY